eukprot:7066073-Heterocapsa_arctica.AAC.1
MRGPLSCLSGAKGPLRIGCPCLSPPSCLCGHGSLLPAEGFPCGILPLAASFAIPSSGCPSFPLPASCPASC